jgi:hypothetical protein
MASLTLLNSLCTHSRTYTYIQACMYAQMHTHTHTHTHTHSAHTHTHTHIFHTHTHTQTYMHAFWSDTGRK